MKNYKIAILLSYISIASASAVILNPALPHISTEMNLHNGTVEWLVSIFLIGYVIGQLAYGPIAKRFGDAVTLRIGLSINLIGIIICLFGGQLLSMPILLIGRFITAIGSSAGLVCTFIILNNSVEESRAKTALSFATISFALSITLAVLIGGMISTYSHWYYCFYALLIHGIIMLILSFIYHNNKDNNFDLNITNILNGYKEALSNPRLVVFSLSIGAMTVFSYCYSTSSPFITHQMFGFTSAQYGVWNSLTTIGIISGSFLVAKLINKYRSESLLTIALASLIVLIVILALLQVYSLVSPVIFFILVTLMYFVCNFIYPTASHLASNAIECRANASGAMNFVNMSTGVLGVSIMGYIPIQYIWSFMLICLILPIICLILIPLVKANN
ncbi:MFS transporter [Francisella adeliensis]|uniref:MFS transporter n=1 Tax=Francisella adeliensis TaxID=2007306 RepID=A0A2Z4XXG3_9GAMM|nr:MFS transporter [Francisella adeliensis]AXA33113.1 MFS transporter [Francisella adeliensis]MBK2085995.1 MFS transporter [Francisella adeliensis]MBK2096841.1 MFS transporter [Francisella adeliensis]QIW11342.1 multidrug effflux MFS transporter [Francisella adeliensis]QIW13217.1 multidrug effflux MFS transporter [Francisella adeliensis]